MIRILLIVLTLLLSTFSETRAGISCYACNDCGTTWDVSRTALVSTANNDQFCRKTVVGNYVSKDIADSCTSLNAFGNGIFCCQVDLCNSASQQSISMVNLVFFSAALWIIHHYIY